MNLQVSIVLRVAAVLVLMSGGVACLFVARLVQADHADIERVARVVELHVGFQLVKVATGMAPALTFPDWQPIADNSDLKGLCVAYRDEGGERTDRQCFPAEPGLGDAPGWFSWIVEHTLGLSGSRPLPVGYSGIGDGSVVVSPEPDVAMARLWKRSQQTLQLLGCGVLMGCVLAWFATGSALRPTTDTLARLARMAAGDLSVRLPSSRIPELRSIVQAVNDLSSRLTVTLEQRAGLAQRLVDAHETERHNLARELHDELAQCLSAIGARATLLAQMAEQSCPALVSEARAIGSVAASTLGRLRDTLVRLRPPELEEAGLVDSLEKMVRSWRADHQGIDCRFEAYGTYRDVSMPVAVSLYRIAQECLTNVGRHAAATRVEVALIRPERDRVLLHVRDDGRGNVNGCGRPGLGMVGMRERVAALRGDLTVEGAGEQGFSVTVTLPVPQPAAAGARG